MWLGRTAFRADVDRAARRAASREASARPRSSSSSTPGPRAAARSSSTRRAPAATSTTSVTRSWRSSTRATRPPRAASTAASPASPRAATGRWSCRCCARTCSARSPRTPATRCSSAATSPSSREVARDAARSLRGLLRGLPRALRGRPTTSTGARYGTALEMYAYACAYSPDPQRPGHALLPFEIATGRLNEAVWAQWLALDPVRMVAAPRRRARGHAADLPRRRPKRRGLPRPRRPGGLRASSTKLGIEHTLELFDGRHGGISYRYPGAIRELVLALG